MTPHSALLHDPVTGATRRIRVGWESAGDGALRLSGDGVDRAVPASALSLAAGGWRRDAIVLAWQEDGRTWAVTVDDARLGAELLAALPSRFAADAARLARQARRQRRGQRLALAVVALVVLLPLAAGVTLYLLRDRILDAVTRRLPLTLDARLGELARRQVAGSGQLIQEGPAVEAVRRIGARLVAQAPAQPFEFRFELLRDRAVNAFAAPGGLVVVHAGLLAEARSADELAGVLAHEVTHVLERHSLRQLLFELGLTTSARLLLGLPDGVADAVASAAVNLGALRFSRDQERAADRGGVELLARARLPATGLESFFERLARREGTIPAMVSTHPPSAERAAALRRLIEERGAWPVEPFPVDWEAVRQHASRA